MSQRENEVAGDEDYATEESLPALTGEAGTEEDSGTEATETEQEDFNYELEDGSKFRTQAEALKHQQKLVRDAELAAAVAQAEANAFRQMPSYAPQQQQQQAPDPAQWESDFYADPRKAIDSVVQTMEQKFQAKQAAEREDERIWRNFTDAHPELAGFQKEIIDIVQAEPQLFQTLSRTRGEKAALDLAASKMKSKLDSYYEAKKPKRDLGSGKSVTPPAGHASVTRKVQEEKPMSLKEQMAKLNEKRKR